MKKIIILLVILGLGSVSVSAADNTKKDNQDRLCKIFTFKVADYKKNIRNDTYAKSTLKSYKNRAKLYCSK